MLTRQVRGFWAKALHARPRTPILADTMRKNRFANAALAVAAVLVALAGTWGAVLWHAPHAPLP